MLKAFKTCVAILIFLELFELREGKECDVNQVNCISCYQYQKCVDGFLEDIFNTCDGPEGCEDSRLKLCQNLLNCNSPFTYVNDADQCTDVGVFPDSSSESVFYVCLSDFNSGFLKVYFYCMEDEFFDANSLQCVPKAFTLPKVPAVPDGSTTVSLVEEISSSSVTDKSTTTSVSSVESTSPTASATDATEATSTSESVTSELSTTEVVSTTELSSTVSSAPNVSSDTPTEPSTTVATDFTTSSTTTTPVMCMTPGLFPDPENCKKYFRCSTTLVKFDYFCPGISYFNEITMKCSLTITPKCQSQIDANSTTPSPSTTQLSTESSTLSTTSFSPTPETIEPVFTTSSTASETPTTAGTPPQFVCPSAGLFPDPISCKTYFRCSVSGKSFKYACPGTTYFNSITKTCGLTMAPDCL